MDGCRCGNSPETRVRDSERSQSPRASKRNSPNSHWGVTIFFLLLEIAAVVVLLAFGRGIAHAFWDFVFGLLPFRFESGGSLSDAEVALIAVIVSIITAWPIAQYVSHKSERKGYQYRRSERVVGNRFEKEVECIDELSAALYRYVECAMTKLGGNNDPAAEDAGHKVDDLLAKSVLYLHYLDEDGNSYCGVKKNGQRRKKDRNASSEFVERVIAVGIPDEVDAAGRLLPMESKSLYSRAVETYLLCQSILGDTNVARGDKGVGKTEAESLEERYSRFIHCANCRLRAIETGTRDTRRINFKKALPIHRFVNWFGKRFDAACRYGDDETG